MKAVGQPIRKKDAMALVTGKPVFMDDLAPKDCLIVKVLRSPHANAIVKSVKTDVAKRVPGIEDIYTWEDVPHERFTTAGQTYPELSPYDRLILDQHVRYVGDPVAIVAGENEACVDKALKMLKVEYWISIQQKITKYWYIRKTTGRHFARSAQIISGTYVHVTALKTGM